MLRWARVPHIGLLLLLANALLVTGAAVFRHAAADDTEQKSEAAVPSSAKQLPAAIIEPQTQANTDPLGSMPVPPASALDSNDSTRRGVRADPVLEELRSLIRDPSSGLGFEPLKYEPTGAAPAASVEEKSDRWAALQARADSVHLIAAAARKLSHEARFHAEAGATEKAERLMQRVAELQAIISRLAMVE